MSRGRESGAAAAFPPCPTPPSSFLAPVCCCSLPPFFLPQPHSWVEHDPLEILATVTTCLEGAVAAAGGPASVTIAAVGLTNQRETTVAWDGTTGAPLARAIVWNDGRTASLCEEIAAGDADRFRGVTGLPVSPYFSVYKLKWLLAHCPAVADAAAAGTLRVGTVDAWLIWNLTGGPDGGTFVTDVTNAARTGLLSLGGLCWDAGTAGALGVDTAWLPRVASSAEIYGVVTPTHGGPAAGAPLAGCLGDQQAATLGHGCGPGDAKATFGTGLFLVAVTGSGVGEDRGGSAVPAPPVPSAHGLLTTVAYQLGPDQPAVYALEGAVAVAGAAVTWLRDGLGVAPSPAAATALAASVPSSGGVYAIPALAGGLLAPRWRPDARGALLGLTAGTTAAHVARALFEAVVERDLMKRAPDDPPLQPPSQPPLGFT